MPRLDKVTPFMVMDILREAGKIPGVSHFEVGEPDLPPSPVVIEAAERALRERKLGYTPAAGIPPLRERIAGYYFDKYGVEISPERVLVTVGTSGAFSVAYSILMNAGERLALADPSYPCYKNFAYLYDIEPVMIPVGEPDNYRLRPELLGEYPRLKALHIPSPSNPLGNMYPPEELKALAEYCDEQGIRFISDEIYHGLVFEGREHTALEYSPQAIVINGFSKFFLLPGMRVGWMIVPPELARPAEIVIQNLQICAPAIGQYAALATFDDLPYLEQARRTFQTRRDYLYPQLAEMFRVTARPEGAFYIWAGISEYSPDSREFSRRLLNEAKVAVTPGVDFGRNGTERFLRFAYTRDTEHLREGVERIQSFLARSASTRKN